MNLKFKLIQLFYQGLKFSAGTCFAMSLMSAQVTGDPLDQVLKFSAELKSWDADFKQIRTLRTLREPLVAEGHVWFQAPDTFLWRLGNPARTLALKADPDMWVIYPRLKRAEKYNLETEGPWKDALALMEAGFPRSRERLDSSFEWSWSSQLDNENDSTAKTVEAVEAKTGVAVLKMVPKSENSKRWIESITVEFDFNQGILAASELKFTDGSTLRNEFSNFRKNPDFDEDWFQAERWVLPGYRIARP